MSEMQWVGMAASREKSFVVVNKVHRMWGSRNTGNFWISCGNILVWMWSVQFVS